MEAYIIKYASINISKLLTQMSQSIDMSTEFIDPLCTTIKLALLAYKSPGTKISIKNNKIDIQEPSMFQGVQRWFNSDERNQLHQLKLPLFYFRGLQLGYIKFHDIDSKILNHICDLAVLGLKKMKMTYECKSGSLIENCLDEYINILVTPLSEDLYNQEVTKLNKPTVTAIYHEYMKLWFLNDFDILIDLFHILSSEYDLIIQNKLADCIDHYIMAKDLNIDKIRPH
ncbi:MAG TPA: hypothetical protein VLG50_05060 [Candidatus Saccharimonadales bacterium]|nr:hypothetical protein [Candidatus Saccharimonadales bacterium]